jgi:hypothetical protein
MKTPEHTQPSPDNQSGDQPVSARRRMLLKAAATGAPVVATLSSGAAMANVSAYQCLMNDEKKSQNFDQLKLDGMREGGWLQIQLERHIYVGTYECALTDTNPDDEIGPCDGLSQPDDIELRWDVLLYDNRFFLYHGQTYLESSDEVPDPTTLISTNANWTLVWAEPEILDPVWALAYYNRLTDYTDIVKGPDLLKHGVPEWQALTGSCWTSLGGLGGDV